MVQFSFSTSERFRRQGETDRALHRRAMAGLLPELVLQRRNRADFMVAFRRHADEIGQTLSEELMQQERRGWVLAEPMRQRYTEFGNKSFDGVPEWLVWSLFGCSTLAADGAS